MKPAHALCSDGVRVVGGDRQVILAIEQNESAVIGSRRVQIDAADARNVPVTAPVQQEDLCLRSRYRVQWAGRVRVEMAESAGLVYALLNEGGRYELAEQRDEALHVTGNDAAQRAERRNGDNSTNARVHGCQLNRYGSAVRKSDDSKLTLQSTAPRKLIEQGG